MTELSLKNAAVLVMELCNTESVNIFDERAKIIRGLARRAHFDAAVRMVRDCNDHICPEETRVCLLQYM